MGVTVNANDLGCQTREDRAERFEVADALGEEDAVGVRRRMVSSLMAVLP
jgi:hypothetical protein